VKELMVVLRTPDYSVARPFFAGKELDCADIERTPLLGEQHPDVRPPIEKGG
jgi:hypothetical protein